MYQTHKCRATAITDGENFIETRGQHNHDISTGKPDARLVLKNVKELIDSNTLTIAVATAIQPITDNIATQLALPSKKNLVRTAQRARKQREEVLQVSPATRSFEIQELFKNFKRFDSGQNDHERIILFGDPEMLRVLETSNFWLADGTFKVTPKMFYQLYSINVSLSGIAPACIYALLPNKTEKTYHRFLEALKILVPDSRPEKILLDFEQAAIQAFQKIFPDFAVEGWHYGIQSCFNGSHPSIWKVIANLQKEASVQKLNFYNASSGHHFTKKNKYRVLNEKLQNIMHVYEEKTDLHFFLAMANLS